MIEESLGLPAGSPFSSAPRIPAIRQQFPVVQSCLALLVRPLRQMLTACPVVQAITEQPEWEQAMQVAASQRRPVCLVAVVFYRGDFANAPHCGASVWRRKVRMCVYNVRLDTYRQDLRKIAAALVAPSHTICTEAVATIAGRICACRRRTFRRRVACCTNFLLNPCCNDFA